MKFNVTVPCKHSWCLSIIPIIEYGYNSNNGYKHTLVIAFLFWAIEITSNK